MEMMGKEFRSIDNGLDPDEVIEFLETAIGPSEESFKRLQQFSALQVVIKAMDESIAQTRRLADSAKKQVEAEAQQEKERILEEAKELTKEMVDQTKNNCDVLIDDVRNILKGAINRAFEKAKETVAISLAGLENDIHQVGVSNHNKILVNRQQSNGEPSAKPIDTVAIATLDEIEDELEEELDPDLKDLQRSLEVLESSLASLHTSEGMVVDTPSFNILH